MAVILLPVGQGKGLTFPVCPWFGLGLGFWFAAQTLLQFVFAEY